MPAQELPNGASLFDLPIGTSGRLSATSPAEKVYLLTFEHGADNRLTTEFCQAILLALDILEARHPLGVVITTSGVGKFYSNGLDLEHANGTPGFFGESLYMLWKRLITFPMPTVAWVNGHAFAGGMMLAMFHDYRIMNPHKGFLCLNEVDLGVPLRPPMTSVFRSKVSAPTYRRMVLEGARFKALDALNEGIIDWLGGLPEALAHIEEFKLVQKAQPGASGLAVFGQLKTEMHRETVRYLEDLTEESMRETERSLKAKRESVGREKRVSAWEGKEKAKLLRATLASRVPELWNPLLFHLEVYELAGRYQAQALLTESLRQFENCCQDGHQDSTWEVGDLIQTICYIESDQLMDVKALRTVALDTLKPRLGKLLMGQGFADLLSEHQLLNKELLESLNDGPAGAMPSSAAKMVGKMPQRGASIAAGQDNRRDGVVLRRAIPGIQASTWPAVNVCNRAQSSWKKANTVLMLPLPIERIQLPEKHHLYLRAAGSSAGDQPAVVFIHGLGGTAREWFAVQDCTARFARTYLYERAGYHGSDPPIVPPTPKAVAADLQALLLAAEIKPPYLLVGHSYGGVIARQFLCDHDEDVAGLVLIDSVPVVQRFPYVWTRLLGGAPYGRVIGLETNLGIDRLEYGAILRETALNEAAGGIAEWELKLMSPGNEKLRQSLLDRGNVLGARPLVIIFCDEANDFRKVYDYGLRHGHGTSDEQGTVRKHLKTMSAIDGAAQREHLALSSKARFVIADGTRATHNVHMVEPEWIVEQIKWAFDHMLADVLR